MSLTPRPDLSIVTITYNEKENIRLLLEELNRIFQEEKLRGEVIIVDDSSPDGTSEVVLELKKKYPLTVLIQRPGKMGIASAYRDGINAARGEVIIPMDADFSHPPSRIMVLYQAVQSGGIACGSRCLGEKKFETDFAHFCGTALLNQWIKLVLRTKISDHTNGFMAFSRSNLEKIRDFTRQRGFDPFDHVLYGIVIIAVARKLGLSVMEIDAPYEKRKFGKTKIPFFDGVKIVFKDMVLAVKLRRKLERK